MNINIGEKWKHVKTEGKYEIVALGKLQVEGELDMIDCVVYKSLETKGEFEAGSIWVRPLKDFLDGRFSRVE